MQELVGCDRSSLIIKSSDQALTNSPIICFTIPRVIDELIVIPLVEKKNPTEISTVRDFCQSKPSIQPADIKWFIIPTISSSRTAVISDFPYGPVCGMLVCQ